MRSFFKSILCFVMLGISISMPAQKLPVLQTVLIGFLVSLLIETLQYVLGTGVSELDDLILNTFGCMTGALLAWAANRQPVTEI